MKVYHSEDFTENDGLQSLHNNLTDWLWICDNGRRNGCGRIHNITLASVPWFYRGEGNANLVISLPREKVIIRFQKFEYDLKITSSLLNEMEIKLQTDVEFYRKIIISLISTTFFQPPILARINEKEVAQIDKKLYGIRPKFRLSKGLRCGLVTILPDYTYLPINVQNTLSSDILHETLMLTENCPTYCIEIKPKQGWIPLVDRKHLKCTFCMNQYLKVTKKRVAGISQYCPLDLFSGTPNRMKKAIRNLLTTPQNNLKIFKNGNLIFSEDSNWSYVQVLNDFFKNQRKNKINGDVNIEKQIERWCSLIVNSLRTRLNNNNTPESGLPKKYHYQNFYAKQQQTDVFNNTGINLLKEKPCDWSSQPLPKNSILQKILTVQQLQNFSFSTVYSLYRKKLATDNDYSYIKSLLGSDTNFGIIQRYLLATTAKDCSIFLALQPTMATDLPYKTHYIKDCEGVYYRLNIGISDIDPKPLSCIAKHKKRDGEVLAAALQIQSD